jgi:hypothetical protein
LISIAYATLIFARGLEFIFGAAADETLEARVRVFDFNETPMCDIFRRILTSISREKQLSSSRVITVREARL